MDIKIKERTLYLAKTAMMCAIAIILSAVEGAIPALSFIFPGIKLGLSNIAVMLTLEVIGLPATLTVCIFKAFFTLITRGGMAFLFSLTGGILSAIVMYFILKFDRKKIGYIGIGISGAFFHNVGQLCVLAIIMGKNVFIYFPILALSSIIMGSITGFTVWIIVPKIISANKAIKMN